MKCLELREDLKNGMSIEEGLIKHGLSFEDAVRIRDALKLDGWHQTHVDRLCEELGIIRRKGHPANKVRYH